MFERKVRTRRKGLDSRVDDWRIDFLIMGTQRGGTTALSAFLAEHPGIRMSKRKELHYFDDEDAFRAKRPDYRRYHANFAPMEPSPGRVYGEATPVYMYWHPAADRIKAYRADIRMIFVLRDPVRRAFSHWELETHTGHETESFGVAIRNEPARVRRAAPLQDRHFSYVDRGFYGRQIARLLERFDRSNMLFLRNEDLKDRFGETLAGVCRFLGVAPFETLPENREISPIVKPRPLSGMTDDDARFLRALYRDDILLTQGLTGLDLARWLEGTG